LSLSRRHLLQAAASATAWIAASARGIASLAGEANPSVSAFPLEAVRLLPSPYLTAVESNRAYLHSLEPDRLLHNYRKNAGLEPKAAIYGGWENDTIAGHTLGHYLSALSLLHAQTGDTEAPHRVTYIVSQLAECQAQSRDGFVAGFTRRRGDVIENGRFAMEEVRRGDIRARPFDLNGAWSPFYNWHKLMAGLLDADRHCGEKAAIDVANRLGGYIEGMFAALSEAQVQKVLVCEYGGLNESFAELYARTGQARRLAMARKLYDSAVLQPLALGRDDLAHLHANTQVPKLIGLHRLYELTGERDYGRAAGFFWDLVTSRYSYVIGGNADREDFQAPLSISKHITEQTCESCNTYNMLKLTRQLYAAHPRAEYFDYYERAHFNHIMAQHNPQSGMFAYMVPLMSGSHRQFSSPYDDFWCCVGTGMESHAKHGDSIFWRSADALYVNLFIASRLTWQEQQSTVELATSYPFDDRIDLRILRRERSDPLTVALRVPGWCARPEVALNGRTMAVRARAGYVRLRRAWRAGDVLTLTLPRRLMIEPTADDPRTVALLFGPMVLAADLGSATTKWPGPAPALVGARPLEHVQPIANEPATFATQDLARPAELTLRPFTLLYERNTAVYFRCFDDDEWASEQVRYGQEQARLQDLATRSADVIDLGETQPERDHRLDAKFSYAVVYRGRTGRDARAGGYFQFVFAARPGPLILRASYWGEERNRSFLVMVDGIEIARERLSGDHPGEFFDRDYEIPLALTQDRAEITVRFEPEPDVSAGPVFGVRLLSAQSDADPTSRSGAALVTAPAE
jgi:DUF1680 family protein